MEKSTKKMLADLEGLDRTMETPCEMFALKEMFILLKCIGGVGILAYCYLL